MAPQQQSHNRISFGSMALIGLLAIVLGGLYPAITAYVQDKTASSTLDTAVYDTCQQLRTELDSVIVLPSDPQYSTLRAESWSQTAWKHPTCIALPTTSSDVQKLVRALVTNQVPFAIRSGGHSTNPFDANIDNGVLIATDKLNQIEYDADAGLVALGPGARWSAVYTVLDKYNVTVVGGRVLDVGVGGLVLGGGLSYLSDLYGMVCDNVVAYEVVLADASVVEATAENHPELFWALKGGANNFGIVTSFKSKTFPLGRVWGGVLVYTLDQMPDVFQAYYEYQAMPNKDLYANMVLNIAPNNGSVMLTLVYLKPVERPDDYKPFYSLTPALEQTGLTTLHELMGSFPSTDIPRWSWYSECFRPDSEVLAQISSLLATAPEIGAISALQAGSLVATAQPISASVALAGRDRGGNALGLQPVNQTWFAVNVGWWDAADDARATAAVESLHTKITDLARRAEVEYVFMNDANARQPVISSYGADNVRRLRAVQQMYDPQLVFQKLVPGGQKLPLA
ncbi:FAD-binding domain-containing protein [Hypoxylon sp. FL1284]|nr:FAD-binding domain-containing protein [Hypoxylon sp. FL1284]